jgi:aspartyl-tRNA(Asn)/glutamyl-tRNA(Gln) amidotransferase subunit A
MDTAWSHASEIAAAVADGTISASAVVDAALARVAKDDRVLNAFTAVVAARARAKAKTVDAARAASRPLGPLAGVPFAVKNLFDIEGLPTLAGSKINRDRAPAARDATLIARLEAQGAVLVGALNMGEYAYDFTGENVHDGASRNPHDLSRMTGGSSGGSGGAGAGAAGAGLGHERVNTGAVVAVRHLRPQADLWPALTRAHVSVRGESRSRRPVRAQHPRSGARLRRHAGP